MKKTLTYIVLVLFVIASCKSKNGNQDEIDYYHIKNKEELLKYARQTARAVCKMHNNDKEELNETARARQMYYTKNFDLRNETDLLPAAVEYNHLPDSYKRLAIEEYRKALEECGYKE
jgi:uncharacterized protein YxeA